MNDTCSIRTVCCKLAVDETAARALRQTQQAFNRAAAYCASVAWEQGITNKHTLHHVVYGPTRGHFGLGTQLACYVRDKAAEAVKRAQRDKHAACPAFRADGSIRYDARTYRLMSLDRVSLNTLTGRVVAQLVLGDFQRCSLDDTTWAIGGAELIRRSDRWYLCITQSKRAPDPDEPEGYLGVDLGIVSGCLKTAC